MPKDDMEGWPPGAGGKGRILKGGGGTPPIMILVAGGILSLLIVISGLMAVTGNLGFATIEAEEVGVVVNYVTGSEEVISQPGYKLYIPFIEDVYTFDRTTQQFQMEGSKYVHDNHVPMLNVRASDGSNFRIDDLTILYEIIPGASIDVMHDSGTGTGFKEEWIKAFARSILRDEFGRFTAVEVADPTVYKQAPAAATLRLSAFLEPHGIRVERINTPNPQFDREYEEAIEDRKEADQEVERLIAEVLRLEQLRAQRLAKVSKEKEVEQQQLVGDLTKALLRAQEELISVTKDADVFATERIGEGNATQAELLNQARGLEAKYRKEAEGIVSRTEALAQRGEVVVREALIKKLLSIDFTLVPYSRDPQPTRLEHVDARDAAIQGANEGGF
jgi:hypothetical protein